MTWVVIGIVVLLIVLVYGWYVALISRRNKAREALSSIDVHLQKRFDLLPNVLKLAQKFMTHEKSLMERLTQLRTEVAILDIGRAQLISMPGELDPLLFTGVSGDRACLESPAPGTIAKYYGDLRHAGSHTGDNR